MIRDSGLLFLYICTGWPKKVSHYQVPSLIVLKTVNKA